MEFSFLVWNRGEIRKKLKENQNFGIDLAKSHPKRRFLGFLFVDFHQQNKNF